MPRCTAKARCTKPLERFAKVRCSTCGVELPFHAECLALAGPCPAPRGGPGHAFTVAAAAAGGAAAAAAGAGVGGAAAAGPATALPTLSVATRFSDFRQRLSEMGAKQGFCHGCEGRSPTEQVVMLLETRRPEAALQRFAVIQSHRAESYDPSLTALRLEITRIADPRDATSRRLTSRFERQQEMQTGLAIDATQLRRLAESRIETEDAIESARVLNRAGENSTDPLVAPVLRLLRAIERKSAHCVISNQFLEYYSPMIIASFHQFTNPRDYALEFREDDDEGNPYWRVVDRAVQASLAELTALLPRLSSAQVVGCYGGVMRAFCQALEIHQEFPMLVSWTLAKARYHLAERIRHFVPSHTSSTPELDSRPPPEDGGGHPLHPIPALGVQATACDALRDLVGNCRISAFEVGRQCNDCEDEQGEATLIHRYLRRGPPPGRSLEALVRDYRGEGGVWMLTADFLRDGLDALGTKYATARSAGGPNPWAAALLRSPQSWLLFNLYYATCMLEAAYGLSPFRPSAWPHMNPFLVQRSAPAGGASGGMPASSSGL